MEEALWSEQLIASKSILESINRNNIESIVLEDAISDLAAAIEGPGSATLAETKRRALKGLYQALITIDDDNKASAILQDAIYDLASASKAADAAVFAKNIKDTCTSIREDIQRMDETRAKLQQIRQALKAITSDDKRFNAKIEDANGAVDEEIESMNKNIPRLQQIQQALESLKYQEKKPSPTATPIPKILKLGTFGTSPKKKR